MKIERKHHADTSFINMYVIYNGKLGLISHMFHSNPVNKDIFYNCKCCKCI